MVSLEQYSMKGDDIMSYKIYPVTKTLQTCEDYTVKINGKEVELDTARVSSRPFNRRWPGHQRQIEQSHLVNFLSLASDEELFFEITPKKAFEKVDIRPRSLGVTPVVEDGTIRFSVNKNAYFTVEPYGRDNALHVFVDPMPDYSDIDLDSPDVIYYGKGEHEVGQIVLKSNQTLFLDEGAVVYTCVKAIDADNIKILGRGILDNSHNKEHIIFEANEKGNTMAVQNAKRQHTVQIEYCTNVKIEGITMRDSLVYNIRPIGCENLDISNVKLIGNWRFNSDGIDMHNCVNVDINNCFIRTFDDSICVKGFDCYYAGDVEKAVKEAMYRGGKAYDVFKNVHVSGCTIWNDWGKCLEIGAETRAEEICDIFFENCDIIHVTSAVLDCNNVDYADVHHIYYRNINVEYDNEIFCPFIQKSDDEVYENKYPDYMPKLMYVLVECHPEYSAGGNRRGKNRDITFENIRLWGRQKPVFAAAGYDEEHKSENILIKNLYHNGELVKAFEPGLFIEGKFTSNIKLEWDE